MDCFYVYPTVSNQPTPNATQTPDPEVRSITLYQAQRFSTKCRLFVPLYRQVTAAGVTVASQTHYTSPYAIAFADVEEAWQRYLRDENRGRGVVLIGHSQGSRMLRALIRRDIDPNPRVRERLVSAIIPGANANTNDFARIPACQAPRQTGCVISYSTFNETPPNNARFGRTDTDPVGNALDLPGGPVICTNPAALSGSGESLKSLVPSEPFAPGVISLLLIKLYGGPPPSADTPRLQPTDHYTGRCQTSNGANVLMTSPVVNAQSSIPPPTPPGASTSSTSTSGWATSSRSRATRRGPGSPAIRTGSQRGAFTNSAGPAAISDFVSPAKRSRRITAAGNSSRNSAALSSWICSYGSRGIPMRQMRRCAPSGRNW